MEQRFFDEDFLGTADLPATTDPVMEFANRFGKASPSPWDNKPDAALEKSFGVDDDWRTQLDAREPVEHHVENDLQKATSSHGLKLVKNANGSECVFDCGGKMIACRVNGGSFLESDIQALRESCTCSQCKAA